jgi:hypothetical protein
VFEGKWIHGTPWQRFGLYNSYVVIRADGRMLKIPAHAGELAPGSTEDLIAAIASFDSTRGYPSAPLSLDVRLATVVVLVSLPAIARSRPLHLCRCNF